MSGQGSGPDRRGGGDSARTDAFRYAPGRSAWLAAAGIGGLGLVAVTAAALDLGGARAKGDAAWLAPAGLLLVLATLGLVWLTRRAPVLLEVGPRGLHLPAALARPVAWREVFRIRRTRRKISIMQELVFLKIELVQGLTPDYKLRPWTMPILDGWIARKFGLRVPIHNLDAPEEVILASVERFKHVQRLTS